MARRLNRMPVALANFTAFVSAGISAVLGAFAASATFAMRAALAPLAAFGALAALSGAAYAQRPVQVPSLDRMRGAEVLLPGTWFAADAVRPGASARPAPAMLLMHGCGGLFDRRGRLAERYAELAARLNAMGIHVLVTDSLTPRGEKQLCTQRTGTRQVTQLNRRRDALGALAWLAAQPGVDPARLGLLGWSNGGSTVLAATNLAHDEVAHAAVRPSLAVAFYPGCEAELKRGYRPAAPLLMLLGEADDWTPAAPCKAMAATVAAATSFAPAPGGAAPAPAPASSGAAPTPAPMPVLQWEAYAGAYHGFDGTDPVRLRRDVPNGVNPGQGVHVGGNPDARAAARARLERFLRDAWGLAP